MSSWTPNLVIGPRSHVAPRPPSPPPPTYILLLQRPPAAQQVLAAQHAAHAATRTMCMVATATAGVKRGGASCVGTEPILKGIYNGYRQRKEISGQVPR
jgi:hypothetical protein